MESARDSTETEVALVICSSRAAQISQEVAALTSLPGYHFVARSDVVLHDLYWDTPDGKLAGKRIALRVRRDGLSIWLAVKGPSKQLESGGVRRLEIEELWSQTALEQMLQTLRRDGLELADSKNCTASGDAVLTMKQIGFVVVQDRETLRLPRDVVPDDTRDETRVAELAIDNTSYRINSRVVRLREIEIEAKAPAGDGAIAKLTAVLDKRYGSELRRWNYSKVAMGFAIADLLKENVLQPMLSDDSSLSPVALEAIVGHLRRKEVG